MEPRGLSDVFVDCNVLGCGECGDGGSFFWTRGIWEESLWDGAEM